MKKHLIFIGILLFAFGVFVSAQEEAPLSDITYPVSELGDCGSMTECEAYCDLPENMEPCLDFAEAHNLIPEEEIEIARRMLASGETTGPGGCQGINECGTYCDDISHIAECLAFAEEHDLLSPDELEEMQRIVQAIEQGVEPPNCNNRAECDIYCSEPENMEECLVFALAAGLIPPEELEDAQMVLVAIQSGIASPPCQSEAECDIYCSAPEHLEECITFAEAVGLMTPEEAAMVRRTGGQGPGGCRGEDECEAFCEDPANMEECMNFAVEYGFMTPEEAEEVKKMTAAGYTAGPGGCEGREECDAYCNELAHMTECVDFAEAVGFMSPEDAARARKMAEMGIAGGPGNCQSEEECRAYCEDPVNMEECMNFSVMVGDMSPEEAGEALRGMEMMQRGGPGGCKDEKECMAFCEDPANMEECIYFAVEIGEMSQEEAEEALRGMEMMQGGGSGGPGDCQTEEECMVFCEDPSHAAECINFAVEQGQMSPEEAEEMLEMMQMMEQMPLERMIPIGELPRSLFDQAKNFLASLVLIFGF